MATRSTGRTIATVALVPVLIAALSSLAPASCLNSVLDFNNTFPYLVNRTSGQIIQPRDYMDFDSIYSPNEQHKSTQTAQGRNYQLIKAFDYANYYQSDHWHYSDEQDLLRSAEPLADKAKCARDLGWLEEKLNDTQQPADAAAGGHLFEAGEQHVNLMLLVDSFGRPEATTFNGHAYWLGSYHQCVRVQIDVAKFELERRLNQCRLGDDANSCQQQYQNGTRSARRTPIKFRYCIGKAHDIDWPSPEQDNYVPRISYKVGLCLPESCETRSFLEHAAQIEHIHHINSPDYIARRIKLHDIYCLPDPRSPLRALSWSARVYLTLLASWLTLLVAATILYSCHKSNQRDYSRAISIASEQPVVSLSEDESYCFLKQSSDNNNKRQQTQENGMAPNLNHLNNNNNKIADALELRPSNGNAKCSCVNNEMPFIGEATGQISGLVANGTKMPAVPNQAIGWLDQSPTIVKVLQCLSIKETMKEFREPPPMLRSPGASLRLRVNLNILDSIKCLCCVLVIFGHIIFIHMQHLSNIVQTIELSNEIYPRILISLFNFVDTFFVISGLLTTYFIFKRFNKSTFSNPAVWFYVSLLRLVRLSPVYLLVFWYIKTLSVYLFDGPVWDYGTDKNSIKGLCINDHWWKSILFLGNYGTMQPLCILPAWSIIVDSQYSLVLPPILYLILRNKRLGYMVLLMAIVVSSTKMSLQLMNQTAVKASDVSRIRLHVYPLISRFAAEFYNTVWNRIGPVAIGVFGGQMLYKYEKGEIRVWPWYLKGLIFRIVLLLHLLICLLPIIGKYVESGKDEDSDMMLFVMSNATIKPVWSILNTILLLRLMTDLRSHSIIARLMSHNIWHGLGKLCFASYLIHYEIILTLLKSRQEGLINPNWSNALREFSAVFLVSTVLSYFIYILVEAPLHKLTMLAFASKNQPQSG